MYPQCNRELEGVAALLFDAVEEEVKELFIRYNQAAKFLQKKNKHIYSWLSDTNVLNNLYTINHYINQDLIFLSLCCSLVGGTSRVDGRL